MCGMLDCCRLLNEQLEKLSKESTSMRVQNARLASQVCYRQSRWIVAAFHCSRNAQCDCIHMAGFQNHFLGFFCTLFLMCNSPICCCD